MERVVNMHREACQIVRKKGATYRETRHGRGKVERFFGASIYNLQAELRQDGQHSSARVRARDLMPGQIRVRAPRGRPES